MIQNSEPYENAVAERINRILKQEFMIDSYHRELSLLTKIITEAINVYNQRRPHWSNYVLTPSQMHSQNQVKTRTYKQNSSRFKSATV